MSECLHFFCGISIYSLSKPNDCKSIVDYFMKLGMSKYSLDLDYITPLIDISREELNEIIAEADNLIQKIKESSKILSLACLKK